MVALSQSQIAYRAFYSQHLAMIARYVARRCPDSDAGDIVAETFLIAWRKFEDIPEPPRDAPWLYGVARNVISNYRRGQGRRSALGSKLMAEWSTTSVNVDDPADAVGRHVLSEAVARLSESDAELLLLSAWEELTPSDIATVLDLSADVVRNRLSRARKRLRKELDEVEIQTGPAGHEHTEAPDLGDGDTRGRT